MRRTLPLLIALILPAAALAQIAPRSAPPPRGEQAREPLPNAVPGSRPQPGAAERTRQNLGPNEALFDAINRGDLRDARDAIARGADLNARNVLGLTPLELSVDLGRNDISFVLLSMRGTAGSGSSPRGRETGIGGEPPRIAAPARGRQPTVPVRAAPPSLPRLWAGDGGAPQPDIGFLGFDAGRPEGARPPAGARRGG
jgi:hypothetical protein